MNINLRKTATLIVRRAQADNVKRLKFTTVLQALVDSVGYRSSQCADSAASNSRENNQTNYVDPDICFLHGLLFSEGPLFPETALCFSQNAGRTISAEICPDPMLVMCWNEIACNHQSFITFTTNICEQLNKLSKRSGFTTKDGLRTLTEINDLVSFECEGVPSEFCDFVRKEIFESLELMEADPAVLRLDIIRVIKQIKDDIRKIRQIFLNNRYATQLMDSRS